MPTKPVTNGELAGMLTELGFKSKVLNEHWVLYFDKPSDSLITLPNCPPKTPARESDVRHVRFQLHWRGLMEEDDFDAYFNNPHKPAKR